MAICAVWCRSPGVAGCFDALGAGEDVLIPPIPGMSFMATISCVAV